jgi:hypothetical protein
MAIKQILRYVNEHPDATDALEGIQRYWMTGLLAANSEEIQRILDLLVKREWLLISQSNVSPNLYKLNKDRAQEVRAFLDSLEVGDQCQ